MVEQRDCAISFFCAPLIKKTSMSIFDFSNLDATSVKFATGAIVAGAAASSFTGIFNGLNQTCCGDKDLDARNAQKLNLVLTTAIGAIAVMSLYPLFKADGSKQINQMIFGSTLLFSLTLIAFLLGNVRAKDTSDTCKTTETWMALGGVASGVVGVGFLALGGMIAYKKLKRS